MTKKIVTFGEILMRLTPSGDDRFSQANELEILFGGGEFNVLASLANYNIPVEFVSRIPDNQLGRAAISHIRSANVGVDKVMLGGERLGLYFMEKGVGLRSGSVVYDRANSSFSTIEKGMINWDEVFKDAKWFHWSGITPALSVSVAEVCLEAVVEAGKRGIMVSADLNYRSKLWNYGREPSWIMPQLLSHTNVLLGDIDSAMMMIGENEVSADYEDRTSIIPYYDRLMKRFPSIEVIATSLRKTINASHYKIGGVVYDGKELNRVDYIDVSPIADRVGSGDAFMGGLIYGLLSYHPDYKKALEFSVAACCLKHTITGDINCVSVDEVLKLMKGETTGKVDR